MKVFLSWSGNRSRELAKALRDWLPNVIQAVEPWLSADDIPVGERWASQLTDRLSDTDIGILCITPENIDAAWMTFEAGALSKLASSFVCPYALDLRPSDVSGPLAQFQITSADREGTYRLLQSLNSAGDGPALSQSVLERSFELQWPTLERTLARIRDQRDGPATVPRSMEDKLDELLAEIQSLKQVVGDTPETPEPQKQSVDDGPKRPRVFIGSSAEGLPIAEAIHVGLDYVAECTIWNHGIFDVSQTAIESIIDATVTYDFAVIILTPDDLVEKRGSRGFAARDNMIFELGLFTGALGRARTFMVYPRDKKMVLPSDLAGVTAATYAERQDGNLEASVGPVCTRIKKAMGAV